MNKYNPKEIESQWQKYWESHRTFATPTDVTRKNKMYILPQLPYPSGSGLHVGHAEVYTACDIYARYERMKGKKVLQVLGWDSFGLPAENYAIKTNVHPRVSTDKAIDNFREQIKMLGISVDWEREVGSHNADYYHWTQWFFLLMYKRGLAYRKKQAVNWCDDCKTVLANEQVVDGKCERSATVVVQREMEQWYLKITDYADRLYDDLDKIDWPEETKKRQRDWIGRSEGAMIAFNVKGSGVSIEVFTTRPDTIFGATYMVLAPENKLLQELKDQISNWKEVEKYIETTSKKTELDRQIEREKTGVELKGIKAINPVSGEEIPVWIADYVLNTYGTGAIMAVPAHDERDFAFAKKFGLPIKQVVAPHLLQTGELAPREGKQLTRKQCVSAIIRNPKTDEFLLLKWKGDYVGFVGGGIEKGENPREALRREIKEETGYTDIQIQDIEFPQFFGHGYKARKDTNCLDFEWVYIVDLLSETQGKLSDEDAAAHELVWKKADEVLDTVTLVHHQELWRWYKNKTFCFTDEGIAIHSDFLNELPTPEAKEKMIQYLEEKGIGQRKKQFKLRDWSVSRQRFWGAPIPMLLSGERQSFVGIHGYTATAESDFWPWLKRTLEEKGHSVVCDTLPNTDAPHAEEQAQVLEKYPLNEHTTIIAHSHGGAVAFRLLEKANAKINKLILVDSFITPAFVDKKRSPVEESTEWSFDLKKITSLVNEVVVIADGRFSIISKEETEKMAKELGARLVIARSADEHFCGKEEPVLLEEVLMATLRAVPEKDLPVILPDDVDFKPTGESPLNYSKDFNTGVEEKYGKGWKREPDTLDTFMCSSWYYYRYLDPKNDKAFASPESLKAWMPVDFYLGGAEHVNGHLLYSRFFTKVLFDAGYIDFDEPFLKHRHQGTILGEDNRKMSKRWGNVINPTDVVNEFGADTCRVYEMFMGPLEDTKPWDTNGVRGVKRFLEKVWYLQEGVKEEAIGDGGEIERLVHKTIKKVTEDLEEMKFNTAIAKMMELANAFNKEETIAKSAYRNFVLLLSPFAPHLSEELWQWLGEKGSIAFQSWPTYDPALIVDDTVTLAVQVNGKLRDTISVLADISEEDAKGAALKSEKVQKWLEGKEPKKVIYVKGKLVSVVV